MSGGTRRYGSHRFVWPLFAGAIFASAFLLFLVQPLVGKRILPWFGGAPGVWTLCLAFYQTALFTGYAYAHLLIRYASPSLQLILHALVVLGASLALPVLPVDAWKPGAEAEPSTSILAILVVHVGPPFLALAATGPLVQAWFARSCPDRSPYPLYAVSNIGSLLALLAYPVLIEPRLALSSTGRLWSIAFVATGAALLGCAVVAWRTGSGATTHAAPALHEQQAPRQPVRVALWLLLSGCAVILLMGVTNQLCLDLASVPFLWILPLVAYLASIILCFGWERAYARAPYVVLAGIASLLCFGVPLWEPVGPSALRSALTAAPATIGFHCLLLFATCMVLHGELYRLRPPARALTAFYLCVAAGGALGGIFVGAVAPRIFDRYAELSLGLALSWLLLLATCWRDTRSWLYAGVPRWRWGLAGALTLVVFAYAGERTFETGERVIHRERGFFGVLQVVEGERYQPRQLINGTTLHGAQFQDPQVRRSPTSYYGVATGVGIALQREEPRPPRRIGAVGLGVGTLATYGRPGDLFRFYEIDLGVIRLATEETYFTFLAESEAEIEVVPGDARLSLVGEQARGVAQDFDLLVIDAFSSDAIPVHLLTREAFEIYANALAKRGLLAIHATNGHFDLVSLVARTGHSIGLNSLYIRNRIVPRRFSRPSKWIFLSRDSDGLRALGALVQPTRERLRLRPDAITVRHLDRAMLETGPLWTDDYSDLFSALSEAPSASPQSP